MLMHLNDLEDRFRSRLGGKRAHAPKLFLEMMAMMVQRPTAMISGETLKYFIRINGVEFRIRRIRERIVEIYTEIGRVKV